MNRFTKIPGALFAVAIATGVLAASQPTRTEAASSGANAQAQDTGGTELYDNFNDQQIDASKWHGVELVSGPYVSNVETARRIVGNRLQLFVKTYGAAAETSASGSGDQRLRINNPAPVNTFQADVIVRAASIDGSQGNDAPTNTGALITGHFFNDGSSSGPGDETGDVIAHIGKFRASDGDTIHAFIGRCSNANCTSFTALNSYQFSTTWNLGQRDTLRFAWEPDSDRFVFSVNAGTNGEEIVPLSYNVPDALPPGGDRKELRVQNNLSSSPFTWTTALMKAEYDNVRLNPEAIP